MFKNQYCMWCSSYYEYYQKASLEQGVTTALEGVKRHIANKCLKIAHWLMREGSKGLTPAPDGLSPMDYLSISTILRDSEMPETTVNSQCIINRYS